MMGLLLVVGCSYLPRKAEIPMPVLQVTTGPEDGDPQVIFLPGRFDRPERFANEDFGKLLEVRLPAATGLAADAHLRYYMDGDVIRRLHEDVVSPARARSGSKVHLVGISMGGLGALVYAQAHPEDVAGVVVLAPYLGDDEVIEEIAASGGLADWQPPSDPDPDDFQRDIWTWLKGYTDPETERPPLVLGWGTDDDLAPASRLLAEALPDDRVFTTPGGHDWPEWRALWSAILESGALDPSPERIARR
jgi:pimeloyl-ACP methyl ester carboxylesterase